jgi:hypothetical protein
MSATSLDVALKALSRQTAFPFSNQLELYNCLVQKSFTRRCGCMSPTDLAILLEDVAPVRRHPARTE